MSTHTDSAARDERTPAAATSRAGAAPAATRPRPADSAKHPATWPVVATREVQVRLTDKNFLISTATTLLLLIGTFAVQGFLAARGSEHRVVVTGRQAEVLAGRVAAVVHAADAKDSVAVTTAADDAAARAAVSEERADAWLHEVGGTWTLTAKSDSPSPELSAATAEVVRSAVLERNAAAVGTSPQALLAGTQLRTEQLEGDGNEAMVRFAAGFVLAILFYMVSLLFGMAIAQSVVEEKQSRIVEIIASAISLGQLLAGKVIGNTLLALGQMTVFLAAGLIGLQFTPYKSFLTGIGGPVGWFVAFFLVGFVALACLWAVAGSLASRNEDLQTTSQPMAMVVMLAFFGGIFSSGVLQTVLSFVPVTSAVVMPIRLLSGEVPVWQPLLALVLNVAFAVVAIRLGGRIYRRSILAGGGRVSWRNALVAKD